MDILEPNSEKDFKKYYDLRWRILRKPWDQLRGSERDELESKSIHIMAIKDSKVLGVGRGHFNNNDEAQIRYMAVDENQQGKGVGKSILRELEKRLKEKNAKYIVLNSRESALDFYKKQGYKVVGEAPTMFGVIKHFKMKKDL